jgi:hypothetical protein
MEQSASQVGEKRRRMSDFGPMAALQLSSDAGPDASPADMLAFFAERGSRAHALQKQLVQLQEQAQQQTLQFEAAQLQNATLQVTASA